MSTFYAYSEGDSAPYPINHLIDPYEEHSLNYFKMVRAICKYAVRNNIKIIIERHEEADKKFTSPRSVFIPNETPVQYGDWYSLEDKIATAKSLDFLL